ncbi:MAG: hypothetical protein M1833_007167 [Piccolia ochrophora]|nr:MAG: hypothetical protein M1833_007167 [Piccolia ochrophora]
MDLQQPPSHRDPDADAAAIAPPLVTSLPSGGTEYQTPPSDFPPPSFAAAQQPPSSPGLRRKPLPSTSPLASTSAAAQPPLPTDPQSDSEASDLGAADRSTPDVVPIRHHPSDSSVNFTQQTRFDFGTDTVSTTEEQPEFQPSTRSTSAHHSQANHVRVASDSILSPRSNLSLEDHEDHQAAIAKGHRRAETMTLYSSRPPNLPLHVDPYAQQHTDPLNEPSISKSNPPGSKLTSFFGWKTSSPGAASSNTSYSDKMPSPGVSLHSPKSSPQSSSPSNRSMPATIDVAKANASLNNDGVITRPSIPSIPDNVDEMEQELREISSELASSIRREMDLEDLVDRMQSEAINPSTGPNRRTSDYFSDSGTSSVRYPLGDAEAKEIELEKSQRKTEQEKAQLRLDLAQRVQEERLRRKALEEIVHKLEEQVQNVNHEQLKSADATGRVKDLEASLEDVRRRLAEERQVKENFQDLLSALHGEIQEHRNERDNLRDEIVPQLRARVEGLESDAAEFQKLTYEHTRMQQELQSLKNENTTLMNARKLQLEMQQQQARFNSIAEEGDVPSAKPGLSRSNSLARGSIAGPPRLGGLTRSNSVKERESRESLADRVKDIEAQRDALHRALKSLLERQEHQNGEYAKRIKALETERDRALEENPRRGYDREVSNLREEINHLRRRADDALEQKWQCEKGLSGLKMDLDRAEQETSSLRTLLQEHDILVPSLPNKPGETFQANGQTTSASLEKAYKELRTTHALSMARVQELEGHGLGIRSASADGLNTETAKTMELLKQSISDAETEREAAQKQAEEYRSQAESFQMEVQNHANEEASLASQLRTSAARVEDLAVQVRQQLESNNTLRERLAKAIGRGESQQKASAARITEMQSRLRILEDKLMVAQQHSEDVVAKHEEEVKEIHASHNTQLQRMKNGFKSPARFSPKSPLSPLFTTRSPRLDRTTAGLAMTMNEASKREFLEKRVEELEKALSDADKEMEEVVSRMNMAQIEVVELQSERDEAMRQTRRLNEEISRERQRFKNIVK